MSDALTEKQNRQVCPLIGSKIHIMGDSCEGKSTWGSD